MEELFFFFFAQQMEELELSIVDCRCFATALAQCCLGSVLLLPGSPLLLLVVSPAAVVLLSSFRRLILRLMVKSVSLYVSLSDLYVSPWFLLSVLIEMYDN